MVNIIVFISLGAATLARVGVAQEYFVSPLLEVWRFHFSDAVTCRFHLRLAPLERD